MDEIVVSSVEHAGRTYYNTTVADLRQAGVPETVIAAVLAARRLDAIKAECKRRIYLEASPETQMNMNAVAAAIAGKASSSRTDAERATLSAHVSAVGWVKAMRDTCQTLAADSDSDWAADASWPEPPADAAAFAQSV